MSEVERDLMTMRMIRSMYKDHDNVHAHTIIALCGILEKYLLPKLQIGKKLYEPKTHAPQEQAGPTDNHGGAAGQGHGEAPAGSNRPECSGSGSHVQGSEVV